MYLGVTLLVVAVSIVMWAESDMVPSQEGALWVTLVVALISLVAAWRWSERGALSLPSGYLLLLLLFHLGMVVPAYFGVDPGAHTDWLYSERVASAILLCSASCAALAAGVCFARWTRPASAVQSAPRESSDRRLFVGGSALMALGLAMMWRAAAELRLWSMSYGDSYGVRTEMDPRQFGVGMTFAAMGLVVGASGATRNQLYRLSAAFVTAYLPFFFFGFRGQFIVYLFALLCIWDDKVPRLARKLMLIAAAALLILVPAIRVMRNAQHLTLGDAISQASPLEFVLEAGGSLFPLVATLEAIEDGEDHWWGRSYWQSAEMVIPNISLDWTPRAQSRALPPTHWISEREVPMVFESGGGIGFSAVAEPYLNFGPIGVVLYFLGLGWCLARADGMRSKSAIALAVVMVCFAPLLLTARNDFTNFTRSATWGVAFIWGVSWALRKTGRRSSFPVRTPAHSVQPSPSRNHGSTR